MLCLCGNKTILMTDRKIHNFYQEISPDTKEYFQSNEEAIAWGIKFVCSTMETEQLTANVETLNTADEIITEARKEKAFRLKTVLPIAFTGIVPVDIVFDEAVINTVEVSFTDGIGTTDIILKNTGVYTFEFNDIIQLEDKKYIVIQMKNDFKITIL